MKKTIIYSALLIASSILIGFSLLIYGLVSSIDNLTTIVFVISVIVFCVSGYYMYKELQEDTTTIPSETDESKN